MCGICSSDEKKMYYIECDGESCWKTAAWETDELMEG